MKLTLSNIHAEKALWTSNSWVHGFISNVIETIESYEAKLASQSFYLATALKEKNDALTQAESNRDAANHTLQLLNKAEEELKQLRPPDPKFKVGQVVIYNLPNGRDQAFTIRHAKLTYDKWLYANARLLNDVNWVAEKCFRALNSEEIG